VRGFLLFTASCAKRPRRDGPGPGREVTLEVTSALNLV